MVVNVSVVHQHSTMQRYARIGPTHSIHYSTKSETTFDTDHDIILADNTFERMSLSTMHGNLICPTYTLDRNIT